ncbi:MAG: DNA replication/repair protein RecF [Clostridia bacterium]|nr:DNA replication/repair protein RecF [Clostridia bacterium]
MYIKKLTLNNFRNYESEELTFSNGINILFGANAQGKTNAGEAIFFLCTGYSPRANNDKLVIRNGEDRAEISAVASSSYGDVSVKIRFNKNDKKNIYINNVEVLKVGEIFGNINSVFFNPQELKLVQETPEDRRRFLNVSLSQMSKSYFYSLIRYNKILSQRNNLLKDPNRDVVYDTLPVWDRQLTEQAGKIIRARNEFLEKLSPIAREKHAFISDGKEELVMKTESGYYGTEEEIAYAMYEDLKLALDKDIRLGFTSIGPHRDDIKFTLNGLDARVFASQGQQRTVALSLKLAEAEIFKERFSEYPILILDDVLSELDKKRQRKLVSAVSGMQTIFTTTVIDRTVFKNLLVNKITIENGKVKK